MHVLTNETTKDRLRDAPLFQAASVPQILTDPPSMDHLDALEAQSIYILREAFARLKKLALLWSLGKDSNVMIWLARKAFFGRVPFPAMHVDTGKKFPEMYAFRDTYGKEWELDLRIEPCPPIDAVDPTLPPAARSAARKTEGLKMALAKHGFDGLIAGIRRDEEATRAKERVFSPRGLEGGWDVRDQPPEFWDQFNASPPPGAHLRIHPILHWTEADIWAYTQRENIPIIPLYLAKDGKRYRSLGDADITFPVASHATEYRRNPRRTRTDQGAGARRARARPRDRRRLRAAPRRRLSLRGRRDEHDRHPSGFRHAQRHDTAAGAHRHRRPCRSRQVDPGRPSPA